MKSFPHHLIPYVFISRAEGAKNLACSIDLDRSINSEFIRDNQVKSAKLNAPKAPKNYHFFAKSMENDDLLSICGRNFGNFINFCDFLLKIFTISKKRQNSEKNCENLEKFGKIRPLLARFCDQI